MLNHPGTCGRCLDEKIWPGVDVHDGIPLRLMAYEIKGGLYIIAPYICHFFNSMPLLYETGFVNTPNVYMLYLDESFFYGLL